MIEAFVLQEVHQRACGAGFGVAGGEDDAVDAGQDKGASAHRARFQGDEEGDAAQSPGIEGAGRRLDGDDFGVGCRIAVALAAIVGTGDDFSVANSHGADGNFAFGRGEVSLFEGKAHEALVVRLRGGEDNGRHSGRR